MTENDTLTIQNRTTTDVLDLDILAHYTPATDDLLILAVTHTDSKRELISDTVITISEV